MCVLDLGAGDDPDGRATETVDLYTDADHQFDLAAEWELPTDYADGLIANHVVEHLPDLGHFFSESRRVLRDGGWLEITVPVGRDARADPDHEHAFEYWTPAMFCERHRREATRPWDASTGFELVDRDLDVWLLGPFAPFSSVFNRLAQRWPAWGVWRCGAGELTATYRLGGHQW